MSLNEAFSLPMYFFLKQKGTFLSNMNGDVPLRLFIKWLRMCNCHGYGYRLLCLAKRFSLPNRMEQTR